jgi:predicted ArsR family transcriptional regulator
MSAALVDGLDARPLLWTLAAAVARGAPTTVEALARSAGLSWQAARARVRRLREAGLVERRVAERVRQDRRGRGRPRAEWAPSTEGRARLAVALVELDLGHGGRRAA